jgi:hypothetical protein
MQIDVLQGSESMWDATAGASRELRIENDLHSTISMAPRENKESSISFGGRIAVLLPSLLQLVHLPLHHVEDF